MSNTVIAKYTEGAIRTRVELLIALINKAMLKHYQATFTHLEAPSVGVDGNGKKYLRVSNFKFVADRGKWYPESVFFFVDLTNGNLLKPATYKAPELKNPRGNVFDKDILTKLTPYGVVYVRGPKVGSDLQSILGIAGI